MALRLARRLRRWAGWAVAIALIGAAVLLTLLRLALPLAGGYHDRLEARLEAYLGVPVRIGELSVEWHGLGPRLRLDDLRVQGPAQVPLAFDAAYIDLGLASGRELPLRIRSLSLVGLDIEARVTASGELALLGYSVAPERLIPQPDRRAPPLVRRALDWLAGLERLQLLDATFTLTHAGGETTHVPGIDLRLSKPGRHRLAAAVTLPPDYGKHIRAVATLEGDLERWAESSGRAWIEARGLRLARWEQLTSALPGRPTGGRSDGSAWLDWGGGQLREIVAEGEIDGLRLAGEGDRAPVGFDHLGGRLRWQRMGADAWQLDAGALDVRRNGRGWPTSGVSIAREAAAGTARWHVGADFLRLQDVAALARLAPLPDAWRERIAAVAPRGELRRLRAAGSGPERLHARARFDDLGWQAHGRVPGLAGLDGRGALGSDGGRLRLATADARLRAPRLYDEPLPLAQMAGAVEVTRKPEAVAVEAPALRLRNADVAGSARVGVEAAEGGAVRLDIGASLERGDLSALPRYLPARILPGEVVRGLERTLRAGAITSARLRLHGRARDFPYRSGPGVFQVEADVRDAVIDYAPGWPVLEDSAGHVSVDGASLNAVAESAELAGMAIDRVEARIGDVEQGRLRVSSWADVALPAVLDVMAASPVSLAVLDGLRARGRASLALDLSVPLRRPDATRVSGRFDFDGGASVTQSRFDLDVRALAGTVRFNRAGLQTERLTARVRGREAVVTADRSEGVNTIRVRGDFGLGDLVPSLPPALGQRFTGTAPWRLQLRVPVQARGVPRLTGTSTLQGLGVDLPAPLAKPAATARRVGFDVALGEATVRAVQVRYGERARALLRLSGGLDRPRLERGAVHFGGEAATLPQRRGLAITGRTRQLDLGAWAGWLQQVRADGAWGAAGPGLARLDLEAGRVRLGAWALSEARLRARPQSSGWSAALDSREAVGRARIPAEAGSGEPVRLRFERIDLGLLEAAETAAGDDPGAGEAPGSALDPAPQALPPLDIRVRRLKTTEARLRQVRVVTTPAADGLQFHRLAFTNPHLSVTGQGRWRGGADARTSLRLSATSDDLGQALAELGYPAAFARGHGEVTADLAWPGAPWAVTLERLSGHADIALADGFIPQLDPGAARLLGVLSLRALPQIWSLNLEGLLRPGYAFSEIDGRVDFGDGNAYTSGLLVDGPPGTIRISGRTGLVARDYDQRLVYAPQLSTSLPLLGALSGGPVTGIAMALVQGVLRNIGADVEEASAMEFRLTGPWGDPKVRRVNATPEQTPDRTGESRQRR